MQSEFQLARTGLQERDDLVVLVRSRSSSSSAVADQHVVQHSAAVLTSEIEVSETDELEWKSMKCMRKIKRAHRILVVDGDQAHFKQGFDILQNTPVRIVHPDSDFTLVWEESVG
jgi:hypothetical protein